jgi:hypothetical protein
MNAHYKTFKAFVKLGTFLDRYCTGDSKEDPWIERLEASIILAGQQNGWFTEENVLFALRHWSRLLNEKSLGAWLSNYEIPKRQPSKVAIIMAGNIPLVGFHDFLCVMSTGNVALVKLSSNDRALFQFISDFLTNIEPAFKDRILIVEDQLKGFDAVIATGSNNTARYFEHYFGKGPNIIRKNRNSVAVLSGKETPDQLLSLGEDVFRYYGLGCRSVSKLLVPHHYDFDTFFKAIYPYHTIIDQKKYQNNYDYNKAVYLMSEFKILDNGFLMLKEDRSNASPIASLFYEKYDDLNGLARQLSNDREDLQCIVSDGFIKGEVPFGQSQFPSLTDYADGIDVVDFLLKI